MNKRSSILRTAGLVSAALLGAPAAARAADPVISFSPTQLVGGTLVNARLTLGEPEHTATTYTLKFTGPAAIASPGEETVTVAAGATVAPFRFRTVPVAQSQAATVCLSARPPVCDASATLTVNPPALTSLNFTSATVTSGTPFQGQVTLSGPAPAGGVTVNLAQSPPRPNQTGSSLCPSAAVLASAPVSVVVAAGQSGKAFTIPTWFPTPGSGQDQQQILVAASAGGVERSQTLTVQDLRVASASVTPSSGVTPLAATVSWSFNGPAHTSLHVGAFVPPSAPSGVTVTGGEITVAPGTQSGSLPITISQSGPKSGPLAPFELNVGAQCAGQRTAGVIQLFAPPQ